MFGFCNNNWIFLKYSSSRRRFLKQIISHEKKTYSRSQRATSHFSFLYHPFIPMCEILYYLKGLNMQICNTCIRELGQVSASPCVSILCPQGHVRECVHMHFPFRCGGHHEPRKREAGLPGPRGMWASSALPSSALAKPFVWYPLSLCL